ncbi:MAG: hypothetical protein ACREJD_12330 [Phycisphaerales bacterium]
MTGAESHDQSEQPRPTHRPPTSNIDPKSLFLFLGAMLVIVGLASLGIWHVFGGKMS